MADIQESQFGGDTHLTKGFTVEEITANLERLATTGDIIKDARAYQDAIGFSYPVSIENGDSEGVYEYLKGEREMYRDRKSEGPKEYRVDDETEYFATFDALRRIIDAYEKGK